MMCIHGFIRSSFIPDLKAKLAAELLASKERELIKAEQQRIEEEQAVEKA